MMKTILLALLASSSTILLATPKTKPNVILIYADDISARELPMYESSKWSGFRGKDSTDRNFLAKTPVIDRLANEGVFIENAWAANVCSPSRAMMMTGRHASLHKWWHNGDYGVIRDSSAPQGRIAPLYESSPLLIGHAAQKAGYATQWVGKTQMKQCDHARFGFDEGVFTPGSFMFPDNPKTNFKLVNANIKSEKSQRNLDTGEIVNSYPQTSWFWQPSVALMNHPSLSKKTKLWKGQSAPIAYWPNTAKSKKGFGPHTYGPDVELNFIFDFIERQHSAKKPFFIYHTSHLGHDQFDWLNPESKDKWPGTPVVKWNGREYVRTEPKVTGNKGNYDSHDTITETGMHTHVGYLDYQLWQYLQKLDTLGITDNTIIIFAADNGTSGYGKGSHDRQKGCHVPFFIYAPGFELSKQGKQKALFSMADVLPTLAEIMGTALPADYELHGESLWSFLTTDKETHRDWIYCYKNEKQLIRGDLVLKDGAGKWWDVSKTPADLITFPEITDWSSVSAAHRQERDELLAIQPRYANYETEHDLVK